MATKAKELIKILFNENAEQGDRLDAAMSLSDFNEEIVEEALALIATDCNADEDLVDTCGQSLAYLWLCRERITPKILLALSPVSLRIALATLNALSYKLFKEARHLLSSKSQSNLDTTNESY